ncbi:hypothetical protein DPMN_160073 [Dreissena polymorpha]|uniref:Uncharacterized protein n=1 Tax=Dreissena polymorpha TaxID=45954 RepID=A0A9D4EM52_DREPO|nr:hypothetical protein DPMN_160073 [Dreissena polymorpha]
MSTGNKQTDFVEQYFIKQERLNRCTGKAQIRINNLKKVLLTLKSEESAIENSRPKILPLDMRQRILRMLSKASQVNYRAVAKSTRVEYAK